METRGEFTPESIEDARELAERIGPAAQLVVRETAQSMGFDRDEYRERVTADVVETARDALFASLLRVFVGTRSEFDEWLLDRELEVVEIGSEQVDHVVWHAFDGTVVAATFQNEPDAAVSTLRRQAFGRCYKDHL